MTKTTDNDEKAAGWLTIQSEDFPGAVLVVIEKSALEAARAAAIVASDGWPELPDGSRPPAPLFTPSEIQELWRLVRANNRSLANDCSHTNACSPETSLPSRPAGKPGASSPSPSPVTDPAATWDAAVAEVAAAWDGEDPPAGEEELCEAVGAALRVWVAGQSEATTVAAGAAISAWREAWMVVLAGGGWDRDVLLPAVVLAKRALGARVVPRRLWNGAAVDEMVAESEGTAPMRNQSVWDAFDAARERLKRKQRNDLEKSAESALQSR